MSRNGRIVRRTVPGAAKAKRRSPKSEAGVPIALPRITRLMALAIWFDELIRTGEVKDYAELARIGRVSRPRVTQIMDLLNLAPAMQEELLSGNPVREIPSERTLRGLLQQSIW